MGALEPWQEIVAQKRRLRDAALKPYLVEDIHLRSERVANVADRSRIEPQAAQAITEIDSIEQLHESICRGEFTAEDVTLAYIKRATVAHQLTNALTEIVFEEALEQARELDRSFNTTGKVRGPLHGVPVTLKDQFNIKGVDTTLGYVGRSFCPAAEDAVLVQILKSLGAIIIAKTNLSQSIMWCETENPLFGLTVNPRNSKFTSGGSTGGENALLALHGSILGIGTDIGGSIRIPQNMVGLYGLKPSSGRFPYYGVPVSTEGQEHVPSSVGPMTRDLPSIIYVTKHLANSQPWTLDPRCAPLPWRDEMFTEIQSRPLLIGLIVDDGVVKVHPPIQRALHELSAKLQAAGHEVIPWNTDGHQECVDIMDAYYTVDGGEDIRNDVMAAGEPFLPHVEKLVNKGKAISVYQYWQLNRRKVAVQKGYLDKWNRTRAPSSNRTVDVLLTPTMPHVAVPHRCCRWVGYTKVWNFLDYTALTFPAGEVCKEKDKLPVTPYEPRNELDEWNWGLYDADSMAGYPVNLQIVGKKLEEEKVLGAAVVIEKVLRGV
ncbi:acetamidase [Histoplasma capsulatum var. duboisii H88]|uniref:Acetamidase n=2 Tax=Ajellomyces capsulatus TaxID=5037 RepID=F0UQZ4_AJEC8|nr:acetamidase [Histoplasma capsulatum H143]EGC48321.1 acetamidase [Histoplasma capsulatum var. duboisii H88]QSS50348.1 acetamidase [Histoplasma capsulatum var. duboisii H88]